MECMDDRCNVWQICSYIGWQAGGVLAHLQVSDQTQLQHGVNPVEALCWQQIPVGRQLCGRETRCCQSPVLCVLVRLTGAARQAQVGNLAPVALFITRSAA